MSELCLKCKKEPTDRELCDRCLVKLRESELFGDEFRRGHRTGILEAIIVVRNIRYPGILKELERLLNVYQPQIEISEKSLARLREEQFGEKK